MMSDMIQICPERDTVCPHGLGCPYAINRHQCAPNPSEREKAASDMLEAIAQHAPSPDASAIAAMQLVIEEQRKVRHLLGLYGKPMKEKMPIGKWLAAALESDFVCPEMKEDINDWFAAGEPGPAESPWDLIDRGIEKIVGVDFSKEGRDLTARVELERHSDGTWRVVKIKTERHGG